MTAPHNNNYTAASETRHRQEDCREGRARPEALPDTEAPNQPINADTYSLPSCSTDEHYTVHYGSEAGVEDCTCIDFGMKRSEIACKHLAAVAIMHAAWRSGVREIRLLVSVARDPFSYAGKLIATCSGCGRRVSRRDLTELTEDNHDNLTYFHGDRLCPAWADNASVEH